MLDAPRARYVLLKNSTKKKSSKRNRPAVGRIDKLVLGPQSLIGRTNVMTVITKTKKRFRKTTMLGMVFEFLRNTGMGSYRERFKMRSRVMTESC